MIHISCNAYGRLLRNYFTVIFKELACTCLLFKSNVYINLYVNISVPEKYISY